MDGNIFIKEESLKTSCRELPQDTMNNTTIPKGPFLTRCRSRTGRTSSMISSFDAVDENG